MNCYLLQFARPELYQKSNRSSHSSDTSSAYSGSDTMTSVHSSVEADDVDLSGLVESVVDSDEEDLAESTDVSNIVERIAPWQKLCVALTVKCQPFNCYLLLFHLWVASFYP